MARPCIREKLGFEIEGTKVDLNLAASHLLHLGLADGDRLAGLRPGLSTRTSALRSSSDPELSHREYVDLPWLYRAFLGV